MRWVRRVIPSGHVRMVMLCVGPPPFGFEAGVVGVAVAEFIHAWSATGGLRSERRLKSWIVHVFLLTGTIGEVVVCFFCIGWPLASVRTCCHGSSSISSINTSTHLCDATNWTNLVLGLQKSKRRVPEVHPCEALS